MHIGFRVRSGLYVRCLCIQLTRRKKRESKIKYIYIIISCMAIESVPNLRILCNRTSIKILAWDVTRREAGGRLSPRLSSVSQPRFFASR